MKYTYKEISKVFDTSIDQINTIIIENPVLFRRIVEDIQNQIDGYDGDGIVSENDKPISFSKYVDLLTSFIPFDLNRRSLVSKANSHLEKLILSDYYERSMKALGEMESLFTEVSMDMPGDILFTKMDYESIIKSVGLEFQNEYESLPEKIIDYMELVSEYERSKLFITVNLRSYMTDEETELFMKTCITHGFHLIMIENIEHKESSFEFRHVIDYDLCEIGH